MGFILEKIPESHKGKNLGSFWVADHDNKLFLTVVGGVQEARNFQLLWKDENILIWVGEKYVEHRESDNSSSKFDITFYLHTLKLPRKFQDQVETVTALVKQALLVFGWNCRPERTGIITFDDTHEMRVYFSEQNSEYCWAS